MSIVIFLGAMLLGGLAIAVVVDLRDRKRKRTGSGVPGRIDPRLDPLVVHNQAQANPSTTFTGFS